MNSLLINTIIGPPPPSKYNLAHCQSVSQPASEDDNRSALGSSRASYLPPDSSNSRTSSVTTPTPFRPETRADKAKRVKDKKAALAQQKKDAAARARDEKATLARKKKDEAARAKDEKASLARKKKDAAAQAKADKDTAKKSNVKQPSVAKRAAPKPSIVDEDETEGEDDESDDDSDCDEPEDGVEVPEMNYNMDDEVEVVTHEPAKDKKGYNFDPGYDASLAPLTTIEQIFAHLAQALFKNGMGNLALKMNGRPLKVGTFCSGTESPILAMMMLQQRKYQIKIYSCTRANLLPQISRLWALNSTSSNSSALKLNLPNLRSSRRISPVLSMLVTSQR